MAVAILLADAEWLRLIVPLVAFLIWAMNRLLGGESPAAKQAKARQQARANPPPPPADKQRVDDEVSEFLRRAAQQRGTAGHTRTPPPPQPPPVQRRPAVAPPQEAAAAEAARPARPRTLSPTFSDPLGQRALAERKVEAKEVVQAEAAMQSHLSQVFSHQVGTLAADKQATASAASEPPPAPTDEVVEMLRDPHSIRDAIIVSEILRRPTERW
ncbi:MAG TPA: hypothetical protein VFE62_23175 [Gemmataceae bacterium]|nr:hypothetical protein [Gemmataceae bacterium]